MGEKILKIIGVLAAYTVIGLVTWWLRPLILFAIFIYLLYRLGYIGAYIFFGIIFIIAFITDPSVYDKHSAFDIIVGDGPWFIIMLLLGIGVIAIINGIIDEPKPIDYADDMQVVETRKKKKKLCYETSSDLQHTPDFYEANRIIQYITNDKFDTMERNVMEAQRKYPNITETDCDSIRIKFMKKTGMSDGNIEAVLFLIHHPNTALPQSIACKTSLNKYIHPSVVSVPDEMENTMLNEMENDIQVALIKFSHLYNEGKITREEMSQKVKNEKRKWLKRNGFEPSAIESILKHQTFATEL